jgi:putative ABC transport system permease protein
VGFKVQVLNETYPTAMDKLAFYDRMRAALSGIPGVSAVALARSLPLRASVGTESIRIEGRSLGPDERHPAVDFQIASDGYFDLMGIPIVAGRAIERTDLAGALPVVVINDAAARAYFRDEDPIGQRARLTFFPDTWPPVTIVGVVGDVRHGGLTRDARPELYVPPGQLPPNWARSIMSSLSVVLMTELPMDTVGPAIRRAVQQIDAAVPVAELGTLEQAFEANVATERFMTMLLGLFAATALVIAAVGVYGVMAFTVAKQTREIGIRLALGAAPRAVLGTVLKRGVTLGALGAAIGLGTALLATPVLESLVRNVSVRDVMVFSVSPILLLVVAAAASLIPAWRAAAVHPMETLRAD